MLSRVRLASATAALATVASTVTLTAFAGAAHADVSAADAKKEKVTVVVNDKKDDVAFNVGTYNPSEPGTGAGARGKGGSGSGSGKKGSSLDVRVAKTVVDRVADTLMVRIDVAGKKPVAVEGESQYLGFYFNSANASDLVMTLDVVTQELLIHDRDAVLGCDTATGSFKNGTAYISVPFKCLDGTTEATVAAFSLLEDSATGSDKASDAAKATRPVPTTHLVKPGEGTGPTR